MCYRNKMYNMLNIYAPNLDVDRTVFFCSLLKIVRSVDPKSVTK